MSEQIGEYNRRIEIWKLSGAKDGAGEPIPGDFVLYKAKWAKIRGRNGMQVVRESGDVTAPVGVASYRVAYCTDITVEMQVRHRGMVMDIVGIQYDEAGREWTDIVVRTGASDG